jgi:hypothetical protein
VRVFSRSNVEVIMAAVMVRGGASSAKIPFCPGSSADLAAGASVRGWRGWRRLSRRLIALAAAAIALALDLWGNRWDAWGGEGGVTEIGGLSDRKVGE